MPDDDQLPQHEQDNIPPRSCTPPTPPVEADQPSPPPLPPPVRPRAMGQLRPVELRPSLPPTMKESVWESN